MVNTTEVAGSDTDTENATPLPDTVVVGCTMLTVLSTFIAVTRSSTFRMYAQVKLTDAPASMLGNRKFRLIASSADSGLDSENAVQFVFVHPSSASLFTKP